MKLSILSKTSILPFRFGNLANCPMTTSRPVGLVVADPGLTLAVVDAGIVIDTVKNQVPSLFTLKAYWSCSSTLQK
jgi:hypothetical protein